MDIDVLVDDVQQQVGHEFNDDALSEALCRYWELRETLTDAGKQWHRGLTEQWLLNRLRIERDLQVHPEILDEDVSDPVVILGLPRSGTTAFQRILGASEQVRSLHWWEALNPARLPGEDVHENHLRKELAARDITAMHSEIPEYRTVHPRTADDAEEDYFFYNMTFRAIQLTAFAPWDGEYFRFLRAQDRRPAYEFAANVYRSLQWQGGGANGRRWVMKSPAHTGSIAAILSAHPNATFVILHRDLRSTFPSICKMFEVVYKGLFADPDPKTLGRVQLDIWTEEMARFVQAKEELGPKLRLLEMSYDEMLADPISAAKRTFDLAGIEFTPTTDDRIRQWVLDNPRGKHGSSQYSIGDYGFADEEVIDAFATATGTASASPKDAGLQRFASAQVAGPRSGTT